MQNFDVIISKVLWTVGPGWHLDPLQLFCTVTTREWNPVVKKGTAKGIREKQDLKTQIQIHPTLGLLFFINQCMLLLLVNLRWVFYSLEMKLSPTHFQPSHICPHELA